MSERLDSPLLLLKAIACAVLIAIPLTLVLGFRLLPSYYQAGEGEVSSQNIKSPFRISFVSNTRTQEEKDRAAAGVQDVLRYNPEISRQVLRRGLEATQAISAARDRPEYSPEDKSRALRQISSLRLSPEAVRVALALDKTEWTVVESESLRLLNKTMENRLTADQVEVARQDLRVQLDPKLSPEQAKVVLEIAANLIEPNVLVDQTETDKARQTARDKALPVAVTLEKGETIIRDGELVKATDIEKLEAAGLLNPQVKWHQIGGIAIFMAALSLVLSFYVYFFQRRLFFNERRLLLVAVVVIGTVLVAKLVIPGRELYAYLFPVAAAPMLIAALLDAPLAILAAAILSVTVGYVGGGSLELVAVYFIGSMVGLMGVWRAERLSRFFIAGASVAGFNLATILAFRFMEPTQEFSRLGWFAAVAVGNGALSSALTVGSFVLLGLIFGITTSIQLMELGQPNQPLIRRLLLEAPGSYHHSMIVGNLAERAAEMIGADSLLVRVGSYYHDIGKCLRPGYFVENQGEDENVHDTLEPQVSAAMVISHVTDGLELARKHRLPKKITDFIAEHHGTRLATYFYHRALQKYGQVDPEPFRYPGPRPQTKETAIVMLADSVEALVRSSRDHSTEQINSLVDRVVADYFAEGQLDECDLTLRDLDRIREAFKGVLRGVYHPRIEYPATVEIGKGRFFGRKGDKQKENDDKVSAQEKRHFFHRKG